MIEKLYIIQEGICLYSRELNKNIQDTDLVAGFLTAINHFANNLNTGGDLKQIVIGDVTYSLVVLKNLIFAFQLKELNLSLLKFLSKKIIDKFLEMYGSILDGWVSTKVR